MSKWTFLPLDSWGRLRSFHSDLRFGSEPRVFNMTNDQAHVISSCDLRNRFEAVSGCVCARLCTRAHTHVKFRTYTLDFFLFVHFLLLT